MTNPLGDLPGAVRDRVRPGSRSSEIVRVTHAEAVRNGYGPTVAEARDAFARAGHAVPRSFTSEVHSLHKRGILEAAGRPGALRFTVKGSRHPRRSPPETSADVVLKALTIVVSSLGTMASTRDVLQAIREQGWELSSDNPNAVRSLLLGLSRERVRGPDPSWSGRLVRHEVVDGLDGHARSFWAPEERPDLAPPDPPVTSRREALIALTDEVITVLGRLPSRRELVTHLRGQPTERRLRSFFPGGDRPRVMSAVKVHGDSDRGRLRVFRTPLAAHGGAPDRFWVGDAGESPPPQEAGACVLDDFVYAYRLGEETQHLERLRRGSADGLRVLAPLLDSREAASVSVAVELNELLGGVPLAEVEEVAASADSRYYALLGEVNGDAWSRTRQKIARRQRRRRSFVAAAQQILTAGVGQQSAEDLVGRRSLVVLEDLEVFARGYTDLGPKGISPLLEGVRRFPNPSAPSRERITEGTDAVPSVAVVDRAEALLSLGYRWAGPWSRQMLARSYQLLGEVARPIAAIHEVLQRVGAGEGSASLRRRCLVAGGLLGVDNAATLARGVAFEGGYTPDSVHDVKTAVLVTALVDQQGVADALGRLREWDHQRRFDDLYRKMVARANRGLWLSVAGT